MAVKINFINSLCCSDHSGKNFFLSETLSSLYLFFLCFLILNPANASDYATLTGNVAQLDKQPLIIYLEPVSKNNIISASKKDHPFINSHNNNFEPAFQVIQKGSILEIKNTDPVLHNAHVSENNITLFNVATPLRNQTVKKIMPRTGFFNVACDLHPWMKASVVVITGSYYFVLQKPGQFQINNIIPGKYHLHSLQAKKDEIITLLNLKANDKKHISL